MYREIRRRLAPLRSAVRDIRDPASAGDRSDTRAMRAVMAGRLRRNSNCVDVGANAGALLDDMVRLAPDGTHIAYEPLAPMADELRRRFPGVMVEAKAVGRSCATSDFVYVPEHPAMSGLRERNYFGMASRTEKLSVEVVTLDTSLPPGYAPDLIKVDTEGGDIDVLRGALDTLRRAEPLVFIEYGRGAADRYDDSAPADVMALLSDVGYRLFDLEGGGPYSLAQLEDVFDNGPRWNFMLHR